MESVIIIILAVLALVLTGALVAAMRRGSTGRETLDPHVLELKSELNKVTDLVRELEKDRENKFGELTSQLKSVGENTNALATTTGQLKEALANTRVRGQWGERMAEDVLRLVGFVQGVNYKKQTTLEGSGSRPDFTFLLPKDLTLNMVVKFPLDYYLKCVEASDAAEENRYRQQFIRDVRAQLKEVVTRDYIDPGRKTLDYVL
ncbi:MAG: DNA recombination protein RmuC, partial [Dehalococcoidia bacterium]|nr:DNA recombination protein RmuC [Dehalococcoidia bacterium]